MITLLGSHWWHVCVSGHMLTCVYTRHVLTCVDTWHVLSYDTCWHAKTQDTCRHVTRPRAPSLRMRGAAVHCDHRSAQSPEAQRNLEQCWKSKSLLSSLPSTSSSSSSSSVQKKIFYLSVAAWEELTWRDLRFVLLELLSLAPVLLAALNLAGSNPSMLTWKWSWIEE